jgi:hypothetical protein
VLCNSGALHGVFNSNQIESEESTMTKREKRILIAKAIKFAVNSLFFLGIFFLIGSLGALETERIEIVQFGVQCAIGLILMFLSIYAHYKIYEEDTDYGYCESYCEEER